MKLKQFLKNGSKKADKENKNAVLRQSTPVYVLGSSDQLGFASSESLITSPKLCCYKIQIRQVVCGDGHTHILSTEGYVYSLGSNSYGILGVGQTEQQLQNTSIPQLIKGLIGIQSLATGNNHSLAIDNDKRVFGWGCTATGAIGMQSQSIQPFPNQIIGLSQQKILKVSCGVGFSFFLTELSEVFACGQCDRGQLGIGYLTAAQFKPLQVTEFQGMTQSDRIEQIVCGAIHTLFLTQKRQVFACGSNQYGELGLGIETNYCKAPVPVLSLSKSNITKLAAGQANYALSSNGDLYVWGKYQRKVICQPIQIFVCSPLRTISQSFQGLTAAIDRNSRLWLWQQPNGSQKQFITSEPDLFNILKNETVKSVFVGGNCMFALGPEQKNSQHDNKEFPKKSRQPLKTIQRNELGFSEPHLRSGTIDPHTSPISSKNSAKLDLKFGRSKSVLIARTKYKLPVSKFARRSSQNKITAQNQKLEMKVSKSNQNLFKKESSLFLTKSQIFNEHPSTNQSSEQNGHSQQIFQTQQEMIQNLQHQIQDMIRIHNEQNEMAIKRFEKAINQIRSSKQQVKDLQFENTQLKINLQIMEKTVEQLKNSKELYFQPKFYQKNNDDLEQYYTVQKRSNSLNAISSDFNGISTQQNKGKIKALLGQAREIEDNFFKMRQTPDQLQRENTRLSIESQSRVGILSYSDYNDKESYENQRSLSKFGLRKGTPVRQEKSDSFNNESKAETLNSSLARKNLYNEQLMQKFQKQSGQSTINSDMDSFYQPVILDHSIKSSLNREVKRQNPLQLVDKSIMRSLTNGATLLKRSDSSLNSRKSALDKRVEIFNKKAQYF